MEPFHDADAYCLIEKLVNVVMSAVNVYLLSSDSKAHVSDCIPILV